ncbi:MAG: hypothetical protein QM820_11495 [Minicystis sp.]
MRHSRSRNTPALSSIALVSIALATIFASWAGCAAGPSDTSQATSTGTPGGTGGSASTTGTGGSASTTGTGGTGGMMGCAGDEKLCGGSCVKISDPAFGCSQTACDPCATPAHGLATCAGNSCALGDCEAGFDNCDGQEANGCETDVSSDIQQCGHCGSPCNIPNGTANCVDGKCGVASCDDAHTDCDGNAANGCEASTDADPKNCGACGHVCPQGDGCKAGQCGVFCAKGKADCNNPTPDADPDGCETPLGTQTDCGFCGDDCTVPNSQSHCDGQTSTCILDQCQPGFMNCDSQFNTGCEVNVQTDAANCGNCGNVCMGAPHATAVCTSGGCGINCDPGYSNCNTPNPQSPDADGCETHTDVDAQNCGQCGKPCNTPNATPACSGGMCLIAQCNQGFANCNNNPADGCEINTSNDPLHCGSCSTVCTIANGTPGCVNGMCTVGTCAPGWADCNGLVSDGCETNVGADVNNCGVCGKTCNLANATATCTGGTCTIGACAQGFANCNNQNADGCEVNTTNDPLHCGSCSNQCFVQNGTAGCSNNQCTVAGCNSGFANCNGFAQDGCEVNTNTDVTNCGGCGTNCNAACSGGGTAIAMSCGSGSCQILACAPGKYNVDGTCGNGCECTSTGTSSVCVSPSSLGVLQVGQTATFSGNLVPAGQEAYLSVTFNGNTSTSYHPHVTLSAGAAEFAFDILANCGGTAISCGVEGGNSINRTDWEVLYTGGDPNNPPNFNAVPAVGTNGTVIIHVYRRPGKPVTCNSYTLTVSN